MLSLDNFSIDALKKLFLVSKRLNHLISFMFQHFTILDFSSKEIYRKYIPIELFKLSDTKKEILNLLLYSEQNDIQNTSKINIDEIIYIFKYHFIKLGYLDTAVIGVAKDYMSFPDALLYQELIETKYRNKG